MFKRVLILVTLLMLVFGTGYASPENKIIVIPTVYDSFANGYSVNNNYIKIVSPIISNKIDNFLSTNNYLQVYPDSTNTVLLDNGYDIQNLSFIDKNTLINLANHSDSNIVIALNVSDYSLDPGLGNKIYLTVKCRAYNKINNKYLDIKVDNMMESSKSPFVSGRSKIVRTTELLLSDTLDKVFDKIKKTIII